MYLWELVSLRLRGEGWGVDHTTARNEDGTAGVVTVRLRWPGFACEVEAATVTEAYAAASRRAAEYLRPSPQRGIAAPHFLRRRHTARG